MRTHTYNGTLPYATLNVQALKQGTHFKLAAHPLISFLLFIQHYFRAVIHNDNYLHAFLAKTGARSYRLEFKLFTEGVKQVKLSTKVCLSTVILPLVSQ